MFLHYTTSRPGAGIDNTVKNKYIYTKVVDSLPEVAESPSETSMKTLPFSLYLREDQFPIVARRMAGLGRAVPVHDHEFTELVVVTPANAIPTRSPRRIPKSTTCFTTPGCPYPC